MMSFYEFIDVCRDEGLTEEEALRDWEVAKAEERERFFENYYNDPMVDEGCRQQDVIDMYRRER